ncbi:MAG: CocE/NonD family hydrolase C-terminal non-catalytic domain-containing protein [Propionibacteriaceae bacterium]
MQLAFWREHGLGVRVGQLPPGRLFVMGSDEWRDYPEWPVPGTQEVDLYLADSSLSPTITEATGATAVHHGREYPSRLVLQVAVLA